MRVYQHLVFISEEDHGVAIFDNFSNYLDFIAKKGVTYFSLLKDEIILYDGKDLELIDIYKKINEPSHLEIARLILFYGER